MGSKILKNVLWGAGNNCAPVLFSLAVLGIYVDLICDADVKKQGLRFCNKIVVSPEQILRNSADYHIIITVDNEEVLREILATMHENSISTYTRWNDIEGLVFVKNTKLIKSLVRMYVYNIIRDSQSKKLVIYGRGLEAIEMKHLLRMLDVQIEYIVDDVQSECEQMGIVIKPVYDLLYEEEDQIKVIVTANKEKQCDILEKMGLRKGSQYDFISAYNYEQKMRYIVDTTLGYNFVSNGNMDRPGIVELGESGGITLVLIGGSTTDEMLFPFRSWGYFLTDKLKQNGYKVKVLNGGCGGYRSSQELVKIIRDIIPIKPDIIVSYTGYNDSHMSLWDKEKQYPFIHPYQKEVFEQVSENIAYSGSCSKLSSENYTMGISDERPRWYRFTDNIKMINSICNRFGIAYKAFLQPCLITKKKNKQDMELNMHLGFSNQDMEASAVFYKNVIQVKPDCMEDVTCLFDNESDIYLDICHVTEHGNEVIAQYMYEYLTEKGLIKK